MPSIRVNDVAAGTHNAVDGLQFQQIPAGGALLTVYASTAVTGGTITVSVDSENFVNGAELNTEQNANEVNTAYDLVLEREPIPGGKLFVPVAAQVCNILLLIEHLPQ